MRRRGNCRDSSLTEAFFSSLKSELTDHFASCGDAKMAFDYVDVFQNRRRRHSTLDEAHEAVGASPAKHSVTVSKGNAPTIHARRE